VLIKQVYLSKKRKTAAPRAKIPHKMEKMPPVKAEKK
jgi:hypothetical protein